MDPRAPALVILAAGASRRLGAIKALVRLREPSPGSPLECLLSAGAVLDSGPALVVTGHDHAAIAAVMPPGVLVQRNPRWSEGRTGSVQCAVARLPDRDLCLAPVDVPLVEAEVFAALEREWSRHGRPARGWLAPWIGAPGAPRFGHPVLLGRELCRELKDFPLDRSLRELRARAAPLLGLELESASILDDLDGPEDLARLRARLARGETLR